MIKAKPFLLVPSVFLLCNCTKQNPTPFEVDVVSGTYTICLEGRTTGSAGIELNGKNVLQGAFLFREKEKLVAIGSAGLMDVVVEFSGDTATGSIGLTLFNHGNEHMAVNQVSLCSIPVDEVPGHQLCLQAGSGWPWTLGFHFQGNQLGCSLDLSNSSMILLPEEKVSLPQLVFFYHLCPQ